MGELEKLMALWADTEQSLRKLPQCWKKGLLAKELLLQRRARKKEENRGMSRNRVGREKIKLELITENECQWLQLRCTDFAQEILQLCTLQSSKLSSKCSSFSSFLPTTR